MLVVWSYKRKHDSYNHGSYHFIKYFHILFFFFNRPYQQSSVEIIFIYSGKKIEVKWLTQCTQSLLLQ